MDGPVRLIPLVCFRCSTPVPAEAEEVAWVCAQCGQGLLLEEEGLAALEVHYSAGIPANQPGRPYWVAEGQVNVQRQTYQGDQGSEADIFWSQPRRFFIPAYATSLEDFLSRATALLLQPPDLQPGPPARFSPATLLLEDVRSAGEFIVVAIEAGRKDRLKSIEFSLSLSSPVLWILP